MKLPVLWGSKIRGVFQSGLKKKPALHHPNTAPARDLDWSDHIRVTSKGYMLGYHDMRSDGIRFPHRFLAKIGDKWMKMAVHKMDFGE